MPDSINNYKRWLWWLIVAGIVFRCIIASFIELNNDEVYYWTYSQHLQWNYFDHPPMVGLLIRLTTFNLNLQQYELFVRLGSIISCAVATLFIYKTGETIHSSRTGFIAAILYNTSIYSSIISGIFILPDSPQMLFWTMGLFFLAKLLKTKENKTLWWVLFGFASGLAIMSKVHGVFLWLGFGLYIISYRRDLLRSYKPYISFLICCITVIPFFIWNIHNDFITYRYHGSRMEGSIFHFRANYFLREIFGEIFYNNPLNFILITFAAINFSRNKINDQFLVASIMIALPMIGVFILISMFNETLPHWSGPAYVTLLPLAARYIVLQTARIPRCMILLKTSVALIFFTIIGGFTIISYYPGALNPKKRTVTMGSGDVTLDMYGWKNAAAGIDILLKKDISSGRMGKNSVIVCNHWYPAAHIDYYIGQTIGRPVIGLGEMYDLHHFEWLNAYQLKNKNITDAWCIVPSNYNCDVKVVYGQRFSSVDTLGVFPSFRNGEECRYFTIYRLKHFIGKVPEVF